MNNFKY